MTILYLPICQGFIQNTNSMANMILTVFWLSKYLNEQYVQPNSCYDTVVCGQIASWSLFKGCAYAYLLVVDCVYKES